LTRRRERKRKRENVCERERWREGEGECLCVCVCVCVISRGDDGEKRVGYGRRGKGEDDKLSLTRNHPFRDFLFWKKYNIFVWVELMDNIS